MRYITINLVIAATMIGFTHAQPALGIDVVSILPGTSVRVNSPSRKTVKCMRSRTFDAVHEDPQAGEVVIRPGDAVVIEPHTPTTVRCRTF